MKFLMLILTLFFTQNIFAQSLAEINNLTVNSSLHALMPEECVWEIEDPRDASDVRSNYERLVIKDEPAYHCLELLFAQRELDQICSHSAIASCIKPSFDDLKSLLPDYKKKLRRQLKARLERQSDITRTSALKYYSAWLPQFKERYPQFKGKNEGFIRRHIYNTYGTEEMLAYAESLESPYVQAELAKKAEEEAHQAEWEAIKEADLSDPVIKKRLLQWLRKKELRKR